MHSFTGPNSFRLNCNFHSIQGKLKINKICHVLEIFKGTDQMHSLSYYCCSFFSINTICMPFLPIVRLEENFLFPII